MSKQAEINASRGHRPGREKESHTFGAIPAGLGFVCTPLHPKKLFSMPVANPCSLCGTRHHEYQAHVFPGKAVVNAVVNKSKNPDRHKDKEARRKYLREYMRKRRGLEKSK